MKTVCTQGVFLPLCRSSGACVQWAAKSLNKNIFLLTFWEATLLPSSLNAETVLILLKLYFLDLSNA